MPKPRLTNKVLDGIIAATSSILAGVGDGGELDNAEAEIRAADQWARAMRDWLNAGRAGKAAGETT